MRFPRPLAIALFLFTAQIFALGDDLAVLRNGSAIDHLRREQIGDMTRLYMKEGYVDVPTGDISSFEAVETPPAPPDAAPAMEKPQSVAPNTPLDINQVVREASDRRQIDPDFVASVIKAESNFKVRAVSPKGARGLMQLMPGTAAKLGVQDPFDAKANVEGGTEYLKQLLILYDKDAIKALAAYNAGPQRVTQYHGVPPYRETQAYISRILRDFNAKKLAQMNSGQAQTQTATSGSQPSKAHATNATASKKAAGSRSAAGRNASNKTTGKGKTQQASAAVSQGGE